MGMLTKVTENFIEGKFIVGLFVAYLANDSIFHLLPLAY